MLQHNSVSRGIYRMPTLARRLVFYATAVIQQENATRPDRLEAVLTVGEAVKALRLNRSARSYDRLIEAAEGAVEQKLTLRERDEQGREKWTVCGWVRKVSYDDATGELKVLFEDEAYDFLAGFVGSYSQIDVDDFAKLPGRHSQRLYELLLANAGHEGGGGNKAGTWWVLASVDELRQHMGIQPNEYKTANDLRKRAVDAPVHQINQADIGLFVRVEYIRRGRKLVGFKFHVSRVGREDPKPVAPATETENEQNTLVDANPKLFEFYYEEERKQLGLDNQSPSGFGELRARAQAIKRLEKDKSAVRPKAKHGAKK